MKLNEIKRKYGIDVNDPEEIKAELRKKLKESHPDNNNNFDGEYFSRLKEDFDYVDQILKESDPNETLVPVNEIIRSLAEVLQAPARKEEDQKEKLERELSVNIEQQITTIRNRKRVSKYSSASILAVLTFIWMFPSQIYDHPLVQIFFGYTGVTTFSIIITGLWLMALIDIGFFWLVTIRKERIEKDIVNSVKLESVQNRLFMIFLDSILPKKQFTKLDFMHYLSDGVNKIAKESAKTSFFKGVNLQEEVIQNMADIILLRAKEYEVIRAIKSNGLIECYEVISNDV